MCTGAILRAFYHNNNIITYSHTLNLNTAYQYNLAYHSGSTMFPFLHFLISPLIGINRHTLKFNRVAHIINIILTPIGVITAHHYNLA